MPWLALCCTVAMVPFAAARSPQCTSPTTLDCALQTAGIRDPVAMTKTLLRAELRTVGDVGGLDIPEAAELFDDLRAASVALGDRSRLRKLARGGVWGGAHGGSAVIFEPMKDGPVLEETTLRGEKAGAGHQWTPGSVRSDRELGGPSAQHRQLQSGGGGVSIEVAAIAFTALIGMVGYAVQARSAQKASEAQASQGREAAERDKAEAKAGKQLERVQLQMAEWVRPLLIDNQIVLYGWIAIARECKLLGYLDLYSFEYVPQPATPYIELIVATNPAMYVAWRAAPYAQLPPADLVLLAAEPALRARYCELAAAVLLPPLRRLSLLISTKMYLSESLAPARLDPVLPGIGRGWTSLLGSLSALYHQLQVYAAQFESLAGRWEEERFDLLQPDTPGLHHILLPLCAEQLKDVSTKEMQLVGISSGSRAASGSNDFMKGGADPADSGEGAET